MKNSFISLDPNPPKGFRNISSSKHDFLSGRVAVYAYSIEDATSLLDNFTEHVQGIIITNEELFSFTPIGPTLWHMAVPEPMLTDLVSIAASYLDMLSFGQSTLNQNEQLKLELVHSKDKQSSLTESYNVNVQRFGKKIEQLNDKMEKSRQAEQKIVLLNNLREELLGLESFNKKLTNITETVVDTFDADFCRIWIVKPGDYCADGCRHAKITNGPHNCQYREQCLHLAASSGRYSGLESRQHSRVPLGCYKIGMIASGDIESFNTNDVIHDPRVHDHDWAKQLELVSFAGYRLLSDKGNPVGVIALFSKHKITHQDVGLLKGIASTTSQVIQMKMAANEKELMQGNLLRAQKMEAIGLMAGGVAHDLNNILAGIVGYPDLLLLQLSQASKLRKPIEAIRESGKRATVIVDDLLTVARGAATTRETHNLDVLVQEYLDSPECTNLKSLHPGIICTSQFNTTSPTLSCSPMHIKKTVMNLLTNAMEAIDDTGNVTVSTSNHTVEVNDALEHELEPGTYVLLIVQDNGPGISTRDLEHIFEPFYTKKVLGNSGTGLGLAIVWNTVRDHGGRIFVESSEGGSIFRLYFPVSTIEVVIPSDIDTIELCTCAKEHILVVDDEPQLRDLASQMLRHMGYNVDSVCSGELALKFVKETTVDLIVLDMLMDPGINGRQTYEEILKLYPDQKAVIASGFSENDDIKKTLDLGASVFIKKPYSMAKLGLAVKKALDN